MRTTVRRDRWGIAHVESPNVAQAFEAQGWIAASDRIWQMDADRFKALGRWAEVVGPGALKEDAFFRRIGLGSCLLYTSPSPRDGLLSRMPSSA